MKVLNKNYFRPLIYFFILIMSIGFLTFFYINQEEKTLLNSKYLNQMKNTENTIKTLINMKKNATLLIGISLSKDERLIDFLNNKNDLKVDYSKISEELEENTSFPNIWIQILDTNGKSLYRSWTNILSTLNFRSDLNQTLIEKKASTSISVGQFDITIKGRVPVYSNNQIIGYIEVISHFNSIIDVLKENKINSIVLADKKYKDTIKYPFSKTFIGDYYVATNNENIVNKQLNLENIDELINLDSYVIKNNTLIYTYKLSTNFDNKLGYIVNFIDLNNIDIENIKTFKSQFITNVIILFILLIFLFISYVYFNESNNSKQSNLKLKKHIKQLNNLQKYKQSILDSQTNIIVITDGKIILSSNKRLFDFFTDVKNLFEFRKKYVCICSSFLDMDDELYIINKKYGDKNWAEYILDNPNKNFKVAMLDFEKKLKHFSIDVSIIKSNNNLIVTLTDITFEVEQIKLNKEKDRLLFQQSKIRAISDTLKNIAHHWRQPLSVISTIASGMKLEKELNILDDYRFGILCDGIINNTNKLSVTIDNFSNFFSKDETSSNIELVESIENILNFLTTIFEKNEIICIFNYNENKILDCNKTDFSQAILNVLDNAIYALIHKNNKQKNIILIDFSNNKLSIKDSGDGIEESIISKVLDPYFTTKHQTFGVGLGLYVVQDLFVNNLGYKIELKNDTFSINEENYSGTNFTIDFN